MSMIMAVYLVNAVLLLTHELESAAVHEWEILGLPGGNDGFMLMHLPIFALLLAGAAMIENGGAAGRALGVVAGLGGVAPLLVHKVFCRRPGVFASALSNAVIFLNAASGIALTVLTLRP